MIDFESLYAITRHLRVLYIEDESDVREATLSLLENYFESIDSAANGEEGLMRYSERLENNRYDLIITDINMPQMTGLEMVQQIRQLHESQCVIFTTAHDEKELLLRAMSLGVNYYLVKPLNFREFTDLLYHASLNLRNERIAREHEERERQRAARTERFKNALQHWATIDLDDTERSIRTLTEISAHTIEVDRVSLWLFDESYTTLVCKDLYLRDSATHTMGHALEIESYPRYFASLTRGEVMIIDDARNDARTQEFAGDYLESHDIRSLLDIPIIKQEQVIGVICHEACHALHHWEADEQEFAKLLANNLTLSLEIRKRQEIQEELRLKKELLDYQAHHDSLTGLPNRTLFIDRLEQALRQNEREQSKVGVLFIDLDRFKQVNDSLGHAAGDQLLQELARRLRSELRESDTLARMGGDEFTLIIPHIQNMEGLFDLVNRLLGCARAPVMIENQKLSVTLSIGITLYPDDGDNVESLLKNADSAMYKAKNEGRNTYEYYTAEMTQKAVKRIALESALRHAVAEEELSVYYQPQYDARSGKIVGMEALSRWFKDDGTAVPPGEFIPLAEEIDLIIPLDRWVMQEAIRYCSRWRSMGLDPGKLSLNLSVRQLQMRDFSEFVRSLLERYGYRGEWIGFEITESRIMKDPKTAIELLQQIKQMGISVAVDDFGTGYSSLSYLKKLPIDTLKIDRSFVRDLPQDEEDVAITRAIIALGKSLNLDLVAEGVESDDQKHFLLENGCHIVQGYLYAQPESAEAMEKRLQ